MKDDEMADKYLKEKLEERKDKFIFELPEVYITDVKQAFLAGLKAVRPQWHYVKDGLPTNTGLYLIFYYNSFFNDKVRCIARYSPDRKEFLNINIGDGDEVIAWQELPAPPKESE